MRYATLATPVLVLAVAVAPPAGAATKTRGGAHYPMLAGITANEDGVAHGLG